MTAADEFKQFAMVLCKKQKTTASSAAGDDN
jgi:hypothetical protein